MGLGETPPWSGIHGGPEGESGEPRSNVEELRGWLESAGRALVADEIMASLAAQQVLLDLQGRGMQDLGSEEDLHRWLRVRLSQTLALFTGALSSGVGVLEGPPPPESPRRAGVVALFSGLVAGVSQVRAAPLALGLASIAAAAGAALLIASAPIGSSGSTAGPSFLPVVGVPLVTPPAASRPRPSPHQSAPSQPGAPAVTQLAAEQPTTPPSSSAPRPPTEAEPPPRRSPTPSGTPAPASRPSPSETPTPPPAPTPAPCGRSGGQPQSQPTPRSFSAGAYSGGASAPQGRLGGGPGPGPGRALPPGHGWHPGGGQGRPWSQPGPPGAPPSGGWGPPGSGPPPH